MLDIYARVAIVCAALSAVTLWVAVAIDYPMPNCTNPLSARLALLAAGLFVVAVVSGVIWMIVG